jgi:putative intracellular protease/amidase
MAREPELRDHSEQEHQRHLCMLVDQRRMQTVAELARNGRYICAICGRVAAKAENLCEPVAL